MCYDNLLDDWKDEKNPAAFAGAMLIRSAREKIAKEYPRQTRAVEQYIEKLHACEERKEPNLDVAAGLTGEMLGAMFAVKWALKNGFRKIEIRYDYEGVEKWVTGAWKSKTELTQKYAEAMRNWGGKIAISFTKVAAHTNVYFNEMADELAKSALLEAERIPEARFADEMEAI